MIECQSAWNTPITKLRKERGQDYRPVRYLRLVNQAAVTPLTLSSLCSAPSLMLRSYLLSKTLICPYCSVSEPIFVQMEDPARASTTAHMDLPQGFKNSLIILETLASDLDSFSLEGLDTGCCHMDDLLWLQRIRTLLKD